MAFGVFSIVRFHRESAKHLRYVQLHMKATNPSDLLNACRQLMNDPRTYDEKFLIRLSKDTTNEIWRQGWHAQYSTNLPAIIREMSPVVVNVSDDEVYALVHIPPRMGFIACREGKTTELWGDRKIPITNGLWYFIDREGGWK